jgi:CBS domain-containing protein
MSSPVLYVTAEQTIDECMQIMTTRRLRHLPVRQGEAVVGVVSIGDIVNWIVAAQQQTITHMQAYITGSYPG